MLPERRVERSAVSIALAYVLVIAASVISAAVAIYPAWACSSGEEASGSLEADLCEGYAGTNGAFRWLAVLWPVIAFSASLLIPTFRRRPLVVAVPVAILAVAFWVATAIVVIDV